MRARAEQSFERALESEPLSRSEQSELVRLIGAQLRDRGEGLFRHVDKPMQVGLSRPDETVWTMVGREDLAGGALGVAVDVRTSDHAIERVTHAAQKADGATRFSERPAGPRLNVRESRVLREFANHPERFVRYNPDDDGSDQIERLDAGTPVG